MGWSNSPLATYTKFVTNKNHGMRTKLERITPHCIVGQWTAQKGVDYFYSTNREASVNYIIGKDGDIGQSVDEAYGAWTSSSEENDLLAVTIECASDATEPYAFTEACYESLIKLCVDICRRNGKTKLLWLKDKAATLAYKVEDDELVLSAHRWFSSKACPGDWLYSRLGDLAQKVTAQLNGEETEEPEESTDVSYLVKVTCSALNVRKGPGTNYDIVETITDGGIYTIVEESNGWGLLKRSAKTRDSWICLAYTDKLDDEVEATEPEEEEEIEATTPTYYRVQCGAFSTEESAKELQEKLKAAGFDAIIKMS